MVFSSLLFVFYFLPIVLVLYYLAKEEYRNYILLVASLLFYSYGEPKFVFVMIGSIVCNYLLAILMDKYRGTKASTICLVLDILLNIGLLYIFKYLDFSICVIDRIFGRDIPIVGIALPIGISFFTFQALSYVIDVYRGRVEVQRNLLFVALYISFFPQLIAGPIVRYSTIEKQIKSRNCSIEQFAVGVQRFMLGFCKKIIIANNLSLVSRDTFSVDYSTANPLFLWIGAICFSLQIFFDFSGYSDMAIGLGKMFGFHFDENFNYPYISKSVTEFWRRWHISLGQWFRDYVYIPLGGGRVPWYRLILNMFIVWMLTGIWHGANTTFIVWGLWYFMFLVIEKLLVKPSERKSTLFCLLWRIITLIVIIFGWVLFNSDNLGSGIHYCLAMMGYYGNKPHVDGEVYLSIRQYGVYMILGILFSMPISQWINRKISKGRLSNVICIMIPLAYGLIFLWAVSFLILGAHNPFIYFNF